ncbi:MAG: type II secretion system F family protein [Rhodoferax sp.]|uniref:type II secretion system F family protein n=1 Tax=Rhodoferax sp. TaxID=50421 RepID=UPI0017B62CB1|nr:type II secretion system F family protein [Rhodoferax sp.]NMM20009.1 type II secretion system F family protein [Rhodoferax sp.]
MTMQTLLLTMIFLSVVGLVLGIGLWLNRDAALGRRLDQLSGQTGTLDKTDVESHEWHAKVAKIVAPIAWLSTPKEGWASSSFRVRFMQAGLRGAGWPVIFFGAKTFLALALPGLLLLFGGLADVSSTAKVAVFALLSLATLGYYFPNLVLTMMVRLRQRELQEAFPDAIDLITICVEAGLGLDAAMNRAGEEMALRSQVLADELNLVALERRVGSTRESALNNFALRTGVDDIAAFVTLLLQTEHFGTNVADSLRILSETMREHRKVRAEEAAAKIPLKLLFPLIFLMFPSLFLVLMGPAVMSVYRVLLPTLVGGQ